ncbi:ATP-binding protein, partial [Streptomyces olivaceus]|nr:ATP-binding protein [Streptomyces olivaceus]
RPATPNGLPVRAPGRTMADADRDRAQRQAPDGPAGSRGEPGPAPSPTRNAGARFGAFHSGRKSAEGTDTSGTGIDLPDLSGSDSEPPAP